MISQQLEKAIIQNKAKLANYAVGIGGVCRIKVPAGHFFIVTDLIIFPWNDGSPLSISNPQDSAKFFDSRSLNQIDVWSKTNYHSFVVRSAHLPIAMTQNGVEYKSVNSPASSGIVINTFSVHSSDIYILFKVPSGVNGTATVKDAGPLPNSQNPAPGTGYGETIDVYKRILQTSGNEYFPAGSDEAGASPSRQARDTINANLDTPIGFPSEGLYFIDDVSGFQGAAFNSQVPIINVQGVLVNEMYKNDI